MFRLFGIVVMIIFSVPLLVSCNRKPDINWTYNKAIIYKNGEEEIVKLKNWSCMGENCYRLELKDGTEMLISIENCTLIKEK